MDYGGFIVFGLGALGAIVGSALAGVLYLKRHPRRKHGLGALVVGTALLAGLGRWLFQAYVLDDGLVGAALSGDAAQVRSFLARGADPNARGEDGSSAARGAREAGHPEVVELLRRAGGQDGQGH